MGLATFALGGAVLRNTLSRTAGHGAATLLATFALGGPVLRNTLGRTAGRGGGSVLVTTAAGRLAVAQHAA
jgi:hypothetical protein